MSKTEHIIVKGLKRAQAEKGRILNEAHVELFKSHCQLIDSLRSARSLLMALADSFMKKGNGIAFDSITSEIQDIDIAIQKAERITK